MCHRAASHHRTTWRHELREAMTPSASSSATRAGSKPSKVLSTYALSWPAVRVSKDTPVGQFENRSGNPGTFCEQTWQQELGEKKVGKMVRAKLQLEPVGSAPERSGHHARVVQEKIDSSVIAVDPRCECADAREGCEVEVAQLAAASGTPARRSDAATCALAASRFPSTTVAPADANARVVSRPIPPDAPVITATRPVRPMPRRPRQRWSILCMSCAPPICV